MMERYRVDFESMEWESPADGVRFKAYERGGQKLRLVEFSKDFIEPDWCSMGHVGYILQGQIEIDLDGKKEVFEPGDGLFIPAGQEHKHKGRVLTDVVRSILVEDI